MDMSSHQEEEEVVSHGLKENTCQVTCQMDDTVLMGVQQGQPAPPLLLGNLGSIQNIVLGQNTWLDDEVMDHSQALLRRQYPQVGGLYAVTSLTQLTSFSSPAQGFVQILNVFGNHWVTVSNIGCEEGTLNVYDSLGINNKHDFCSQVVSLLQYSGKTVWIGWPHVQQQQGWSDCGLFTIANSLTLCMGGDPGKLCYDQKQMRDHLFSCFVDGSLTPFPSCERTPLPEVHFCDVEVYCTCRRPYRIALELMVECGRCGEWFHDQCEDLQPDDLISMEEYMCCICRVTHMGKYGK
ncbi:uncharacterized protein LOC131722031 [Acipenser ruthenus]|uniref:uncharacterized protein LOC131722031 n=1 Tax=Acipenser ruthenus TaxID=7906 RepID=UPI00274171F5|nr:uncharacterized protein LOC131722031 [Acipenser ruthenus]